MMISTKGRYALRVMVCLAEENTDNYIPLKPIAEKEGISIKYLESIMTLLSKNGLVDSVHGKGGGYKLNRKPSEYTVGELLRTTEGSLAPISCVDEGVQHCKKACECKTLPVWDKLNNIINEYLDSVTLEDLVTQQA